MFAISPRLAPRPLRNPFSGLFEGLGTLFRILRVARRMTALPEQSPEALRGTLFREMRKEGLI